MPNPHDLDAKYSEKFQEKGLFLSYFGGKIPIVNLLDAG